MRKSFPSLGRGHPSIPHFTGTQPGFHSTSSLTDGSTTGHSSFSDQSNWMPAVRIPSGPSHEPVNGQQVEGILAQLSRDQTRIDELMHCMDHMEFEQPDKMPLHGEGIAS